jgi:short-subunit dehydrogenase
LTATPQAPFIAAVTGASSGIGEATARRLVREPNTHVVLIARREDRLRQLASELGEGNATVIAQDLTDAQAPAVIARTIEQQHGALHLLVNNAGGAWRGGFAETGWAHVAKHMELNFEAPVRLTEALLPLLRKTAAATNAGVSPRTSIVNIASTAGRVSRANSGAYSASKFALIGWSDALQQEEREHGVHVGLVLPGFIRTEGFPASELLANPATRWIVSTTDKVAEAIVEAGPGGKAERYVPRGYWLAASARLLVPPLARRFAGAMTTATKAD